jgi:quinol monooxygenase YgiN
MKAIMIGLLSTAAAIGVACSARADDSKAGVYEVSLINFLPSAVASRPSDVTGLIDQMVKDAKADEGLVSIKVTQQLGQPSNYTVVAQWKDQAALDKHGAAGHTIALYDRLDPMITGPVYRREFSAFQ